MCTDDLSTVYSMSPGLPPDLPLFISEGDHSTSNTDEIINNEQSSCESETPINIDSSDSDDESSGEVYLCIHFVHC